MKEDRMSEAPCDIIKWLESPAGERWSRDYHHEYSDSRQNLLMVLKEDDEDVSCEYIVLWHG